MAIQPIDGCGCMYDAAGRLFRSRCICPPEMTPEQTLRGVAGLGGSIGDAVAGMLAEMDAAHARVAELERIIRDYLRATEGYEVSHRAQQWRGSLVTAVANAPDRARPAETTECDAACIKVAALSAAVLQLHRSVPQRFVHGPYPGAVGDRHYTVNCCAECEEGTEYPCPTVRALDVARADAASGGEA